MVKKTSLLLTLICGIMVFLASCSSKSYPCPGLGQVNEADLSQFDENGQLKSGKGSKKAGPVKRINHENGLVNKKKPKKLNAHRRTHI